MKFSLNIKKENKTIQYTESLLKKLIKFNKHELVNNDLADFILISLCDVSQIKLLKDISENYKNKKIIVGEHFAINFVVCSLFADYVIVGQGFEFFKCKDEREIRNLDCCYFPEKKYVIPSTYINWKLAPIAQVSKNMYYYWAGVGCKNKCSFCLTSWVNKCQKNDPLLIKKASNIISNKKHNLKLIANEEYDQPQIKELVKDVMLNNFLLKKYNSRLVRIGAEFATEESRKKNGKFFTNEQFIKAIHKADKEKVNLMLFLIAGLNTFDEWINFFNLLPVDHKTYPKITFKVTNLEYHQGTPLYKKRKEIDINKYLTKENSKEIFKKFGHINWRLRIMKPKYPAFAIWRQGISCSINMEQFNIFWELRNNKNLENMVNVLFESGVINTDYEKDGLIDYKAIHKN